MVSFKEPAMEVDVHVEAVEEELLLDEEELTARAGRPGKTVCV